MKRDFKVGMVSEEEFNSEITDILANADKGIFPEKAAERVYFGDMKTFLEYITPKLCRGGRKDGFVEFCGILEKKKALGRMHQVPVISYGGATRDRTADLLNVSDGE